VAASGIGKASAIKLADKDVDGLEKFQWEIRAIGVECFVASLDVLYTFAFIASAQPTNDKFNRIDMSFNDTGVSLIDSVENQIIQDFHWLMNINFWGVVHGTHNFYFI
jgi:NADP-dependent 3-hydroxy acid dehydrogenase YdfG